MSSKQTKVAGLNLTGLVQKTLISHWLIITEKRLITNKNFSDKTLVVMTELDVFRGGLKLHVF